MVELIEQPHGLLIRLTDKKELKALLKKNKYVEPYEILDEAGYIGNGWWQVSPESIGALTDAPIIGYDIGFTDEGEVELYDESKIYWYPNYMIKDPWKVLLKEGEVFFDLAE